MKKCEVKFGLINLRIGMAVVINAIWGTSALYALPAPISFDVRDRNGKIGEVSIKVLTDIDLNEGVFGQFDVTRKNASGATMTIKELENSLGGLRFNWFQMVTLDPFPPDDINGNPIQVPYIDPYKNGYYDEWADNRPWYWDEYSKPPFDPREWNNENLLDNNVKGTRLDFDDFPTSSVGDRIEFKSFLIASQPQSKIYDLLGGFFWSAKVQDDGFTDITSLISGARFTTGDAQKIRDEFDYTRVPLLQSPSGYYTDIFDGALNGVPDDLIGSLLGEGIGSAPLGYSPNDDGFGGPYSLGFSMNYFGNTYNSIYINNNGNISFGNGVSQFTPDPLNITSIAPMIAPYWADVDTRGTGTVAIRTDVPNQVIVTWDKVGYYYQHTDKLASFQLVLRGPDYPVPEDEGNIGFFFRNVGWETGDGSDGMNGFGGTQATVGFGDGFASVNPGEFSLPGSQLSGISQLVSNRHFWFNLNNQGTIEGSSQDNPLLPDGTTDTGT